MRCPGFLDVFSPAFVRIRWIDAESDDLHAAFFEVRFRTRYVAQFRGAHWGEVFRVGEQNRPTVANPIVETNGAFRGLRCEIGCYVAKS